MKTTIPVIGLLSLVTVANAVLDQPCQNYGPGAQLIPAPPENRTSAEHVAWLDGLRALRKACRASIGLNDSIFEEPALRWTQSAYVTVQMHPFDRYFYNRSAKNYIVGRWLADLDDRYGGVDAALVWPTYPQLGYDDRSAFDMIGLLPGGMDSIRGFASELHAAGVKVLWPERGSMFNDFFGAFRR